MDNKHYKVCRDQIYIGKVIKANGIYCCQNDKLLFDSTPNRLIAMDDFTYRSMLFTLTEEKMANDLLHCTPYYPILNVTDNRICLSSKDGIVIQDACNLGVLLAYFGYEKELTFENILEIRKKFFNGHFAYDHCELFGYKEIQPEDRVYYKNESKMAGWQRKKMIIQTKLEQKLGQRIFVSKSEALLPWKYWKALNERGDYTLLDVIDGVNDRRNAFTPHKKEGHIKKLTRF